jgi:hypothetical protein
MPRRGDGQERDPAVLRVAGMLKVGGVVLALGWCWAG